MAVLCIASVAGEKIDPSKTYRINKDGKTVRTFESKGYQESVTVACRNGAKITEEYEEDVKVTLFFSKQKTMDGFVEILEGIKHAGIIKNTKQIVHLEVVKVDEKKKQIGIVVKDIPRR